MEETDGIFAAALAYKSDSTLVASAKDMHATIGLFHIGASVNLIHTPIFVKLKS